MPAVLSILTLAPNVTRSIAASTTSLVPTAPSYVSATPGNGSATVRWTIPSSDNGSAITGYVVTPYLAAIAQARIAVGLGTQATISGLANAETYTFSVAARNAYGTGPARSSLPITIGAPVAPTGVSARPAAMQLGAASSMVSWTAPATNNGSAITAYVVTPYVYGVALWPRSFPPTSSAGVVTALKFGGTYTFRVAAKNANGTGPKSALSTPLKLSCVGVAMPNGQSDINAAPGGTTFCLSGTHNWTLTPKNGDTFIGPAILDGAHSTVSAILGNGTSNVILSALEVRNYHGGDQQAAISAHGTTGWIFRDLRVHDNGSSAGGTGANLGVASRVLGGRYYNNRQLGIGGGGGANGWLIWGAEIDHNNFTDDAYTTRNMSCGYEGGGVKWTADNTTVKNSKIHDNACKGLWADLNADNTTIINNWVYGNWDEGIFIEISSGATVTGNRVSRNGLKNYNHDSNGCGWLWGGGITFASSDHGTISGNVVTGNCNGITGTQQTRPDGNPGLLEYLNIHDNTITGPGGETGVVADNGADLSTRSIVFAKNSFSNGMSFCYMQC